jgi:hypothetical protein
MDNQQERLFNLGWLIGIIDGEGGVMLHTVKKGNGYYAPAIYIGNTNLAIVDKVSKILTDLDVGHHILSKTLKSGKEFKSVRIYGLKRTHKLLSQTIQYFECKKRQAEILLEYASIRFSKYPKEPLDSREHSLFNELRDLHK